MSEQLNYTANHALHQCETHSNINNIEKYKNIIVKSLFHITKEINNINNNLTLNKKEADLIEIIEALQMLEMIEKTNDT